MDQFAKETIPVSLEEEMRRSYLDYAMSVIVGRALPDVVERIVSPDGRVLPAGEDAATFAIGDKAVDGSGVIFNSGFLNGLEAPGAAKSAVIAELEKRTAPGRD